MYETIIAAKEGSVTRITFNRPEKRNALTIQLFTELLDVLNEIEEDDEARVVILAGAGPAFCAGRDFSESTQASPKAAAHYTRLNLAGRERLRRFPKPVIGRVHGPAAGGGCALATECCDITIASASARFSIREVQAGTIPGIPVFTLGRARTLGMLLTGDWLAADQAERWGLIYKVVSEEDLDPTVDRVAAQLAEQSAQAMEYTKRAACFLLDSAGYTQTEQYLLECRRLLHQSKARIEAQQAFVDKKRR